MLYIQKYLIIYIFRTYDPEAAFERMRKRGVLESASP